MASAGTPAALVEHLDGKASPEDWALTFTAIFAIGISLLGFLGNLLTIVALPHTKKLRTAATWFVINLAVIEMVFCVTVLPMSAAHLLHLRLARERLFDTNGCKLFVYLRYVIIQAELLSIASIAINRCILIAIPKKYPSIFSQTKTCFYIVGIWGLSLFVMVFPLTEVYGSFSYNANTQECDFGSKAMHARKVYLAVGFLIPCIVIILSYSYIFYKSRESARRIQERNNMAVGSADNPRPSAGLRNREMRIARTIAVIFLVFIICCTPVSIAHYYGSQGKFPMLLLLLHPLYWLQYCLNGFIYVFMNKQYREAYISYISYYWPNFKFITQQCYQPAEDETSVSNPGSKAPGNAFRKMSVSRFGNTESPLPTPKYATPTAKKKFQCWDPPRRKISSVSSDSVMGSQSGAFRANFSNKPPSLKVHFSEPGSGRNK